MMKGPTGPFSFNALIEGHSWVENKRLERCLRTNVAFKPRDLLPPVIFPDEA